MNFLIWYHCILDSIGLEEVTTEDDYGDDDEFDDDVSDSINKAASNLVKKIISMLSQIINNIDC